MSTNEEEEIVPVFIDKDSNWLHSMREPKEEPELEDEIKMSDLSKKLPQPGSEEMKKLYQEALKKAQEEENDPDLIIFPNMGAMRGEEESK
jgi:hypothetical protein